MGMGMGKTGRDPTKDVSEDESGDAKHVFVDPFPMEYITGEINDYVQRAEVTPERIGGYWFGRRGPKGKPVPPPKEDERVSNTTAPSLCPLNRRFLTQILHSPILARYALPWWRIREFLSPHLPCRLV